MTKTAEETLTENSHDRMMEYADLVWKRAEVKPEHITKGMIKDVNDKGCGIHPRLFALCVNVWLKRSDWKNL